MHLLFYPNINKKLKKCGFLTKNINLSLENFKTPGGH